MTAEFMGYYFGLPVKVRQDVAIDIKWPSYARRMHPQWGDRQLLTSYILDQVLLPTLEDDAATLLGFTAWDLWPGEGWNFVFGSASIKERVGVWSIYRNGNLAGNDQEFALALKRTIKTAVHETGHMFSILHCTAYACCMNGSNHRAEADSRPLALCPECLAKLLLATQTDPVKRFAKLADFRRRYALPEEARFFEKSLKVVSE